MRTFVCSFDRAFTDCVFYLALLELFASKLAGLARRRVEDFFLLAILASNFGFAAGFFAWRGQAQLVRLLAPDTLFIARTDVQLADRALVPLEQVGVGGQETVRGYRQDLLLADECCLCSGDLQGLDGNEQSRSLLETQPEILPRQGGDTNTGHRLCEHEWAGETTLDGRHHLAWDQIQKVNVPGSDLFKARISVSKSSYWSRAWICKFCD